MLVGCLKKSAQIIGPVQRGCTWVILRLLDLPKIRSKVSRLATLVSQDNPISRSVAGDHLNIHLDQHRDAGEHLGECLSQGVTLRAASNDPLLWESAEFGWECHHPILPPSGDLENA